MDITYTRGEGEGLTYTTTPVFLSCYQQDLHAKLATTGNHSAGNGWEWMLCKGTTPHDSTASPKHHSLALWLQHTGQHTVNASVL